MLKRILNWKKSTRMILSKNTLMMVGTILITAAFALIICFLTMGETRIMGSRPETIKNISLVCTNDDVQYPFFNYDGSVRKDTKITALFNNDKLDSISLVHVLYYNDVNKVKASEAHNHASLGIALADGGVLNEEVIFKFSKFDDKVILNLYLDEKNASGAVWKYFLLNEDEYGTADAIEDAYKSRNFRCVRNN